MGNLADSRRHREAKGLYRDNPGDGTIIKNELDYIPFLGNNPSDEKPAVYTGRFNMPDGAIELEAKRSGGKLYVTCLADEKHNRAIFECVERFVTAIFDGSAREIKDADPEDSQIKKLRKELSQVEKERDSNEKELEKFKAIMKSNGLFNG
tara:strand:+ start:183 stop:635 length:453 start_codon:yes stop_codon:yes gene_type:complete